MVQRLTFRAGIYRGFGMSETAAKWDDRMRSTATAVFEERHITDLVGAELAFSHRIHIRKTGKGRENNPALADAWEAALRAVNAARGEGVTDVIMIASERWR